jgi:hypothetical protein
LGKEKSGTLPTLSNFEKRIFFINWGVAGKTSPSTFKPSPWLRPSANKASWTHIENDVVVISRECLYNYHHETELPSLDGSPLKSTSLAALPSQVLRLFHQPPERNSQTSRHAIRNVNTWVPLTALNEGYHFGSQVSVLRQFLLCHFLCFSGAPKNLGKKRGKIFRKHLETLPTLKVEFTGTVVPILSLQKMQLTR